MQETDASLLEELGAARRGLELALAGVDNEAILAALKQWREALLRTSANGVPIPEQMTEPLRPRGTRQG